MKTIPLWMIICLMFSCQDQQAKSYQHANTEQKDSGERQQTASESETIAKSETSEDPKSNEESAIPPESITGYYLACEQLNASSRKSKQMKTGCTIRNSQNASIIDIDSEMTKVDWTLIPNATVMDYSFDLQQQGEFHVIYTINFNELKEEHPTEIVADIQPIEGNAETLKTTVSSLAETLVAKTIQEVFGP